MAKKLPNLYQVCYANGGGSNALHTTLEAAVKEARDEIDGDPDWPANKTLHICEIREMKQIVKKRKG